MNNGVPKQQTKGLVVFKKLVVFRLY